MIHPEAEKVYRVLEGADVDQHIQCEKDYSEFSKDPSMQNRLKKLLWQRR